VSEMIERVARAIAQNPPYERTEYRDSGPVIVRDFESTARAAIEAMRKPTVEMIAVGSWASHGGGEVGSFGARNAYDCMIDAALKDTP